MKTKFINRHLCLLLIVSMILTSCLGQTSSARKSISKSNSTTNGNTSSGGSGAVSDTTTTDNSTISSQKVELSHLVDPFTGTYKKKVTIPKNYKGYLYIAGLNLTALSSKIIKVRFNFGTDRQTIPLTATLARASGITPKTDIQVLVLDLTKRPFQDMKLLYDLYDYNDYSSSTTEPVTNPLDGGLYCRGLKLEDDPTFVPTTEGDTCSKSTDKCLYSYAKIQDSTILDSSGVSSVPTKPQIWSSTESLTASMVQTMCLPDYSQSKVNELLGLVSISTSLFSGSYRAINMDGWYIKPDAMFSYVSGVPYGLFDTATGSKGDPKTWSKSMLFPRAGKVDLSTNTKYIGHETNKFGPRSSSILESGTSGTSQYIDGCNIRAINYDSSTNLGIGSCNVTGNIEIFYMDGATEVLVTKSNELKLQLTRPSITNTEGKQVLASSFKQCESNSTCGANECCYNSRCWSNDLVSQCVDDSIKTGSRENGTSCTSDFQCGSLCCNGSTGTCTPHNSLGTDPILCSKTAGQTCIAKEFCAKEYIPICKLYKNGTNQDGTVRCVVKCPTVATFGSCIAGTCVSPTAQTDTSNFNLTTCEGAIDP